MTTHTLVTGAGGFIGGHLVTRLLNDGCNVTAVDRKPLDRWYQKHHDATNISRQVRNLQSSVIQRADEVYHLAADMGGIGYITSHLVSCADNIVDTVHLLDSVESGQRVFFSSSACVYPVSVQAAGGNVALKESDVWPYDPEPGYGFEKLYAEQLMQYHMQERGIIARVARFHNVAGPHGDWNTGREKAPAAISRKIALAKLHGINVIDVWGDGEQTRSFMYVDDCVEGILRITRSDVDTPLNLGSEEFVTINELVHHIAKIGDLTDYTIEHDLTAPQGVRGRNSDNTLIREKLGWEPTTRLDDWLVPTYQWIFNQVEAHYRARFGTREVKND